MLVHIFRAASSPCCSNKSRRQTADENVDQDGKEIAEVVHHNFYVDDLKSIRTVNPSIHLDHTLCRAFVLSKQSPW